MINQQILARARHAGCRFLLGTQYSLIIATAAVLSTIRSWVPLIFPLPCQTRPRVQSGMRTLNTATPPLFSRLLISPV